jgi:hypothetical protein
MYALRLNKGLSLSKVAVDKCQVSWLRVFRVELRRRGRQIKNSIDFLRVIHG